MKRLKRISGAARAKLRRSAGETLAETLIAVMIAAIAVTMLAFMLSTSASLVRRSTESFDAYYAQNNALTTYSGTGQAGKAHLREGSLESVGSEVMLIAPAPGAIYDPDEGTGVACYVNGEAPAGTPVISYKYEP